MCISTFLWLWGRLKIHSTREALFSKRSSRSAWKLNCEFIERGNSQRISYWRKLHVLPNPESENVFHKKISKNVKFFHFSTKLQLQKRSQPKRPVNVDFFEKVSFSRRKVTFLRIVAGGKSNILFNRIWSIFISEKLHFLLPSAAKLLINFENSMRQHFIIGKDHNGK